MTRAACVRMDAVRVAAGAALLLTVLEVSGCGRSKYGPTAASPPPSTAVARLGTLRIGLSSPRRGNLLFTSDTPTTALRIGSATYTADSLDATGRRWLRTPQTDADSAGTL